MPFICSLDVPLCVAAPAWLSRPQVIPFIQEPKLFREKVKALFQKHCGETAVSVVSTR